MGRPATHEEIMQMAGLTDIACKIVGETDKAIAVADGTMEKHEGREREKWYWIPKRVAEVDPSEYDIGDTVTVTLPEAMAQDKGLI